MDLSGGTRAHDRDPVSADVDHRTVAGPRTALLSDLSTLVAEQWAGAAVLMLERGHGDDQGRTDADAGLGHAAIS
jgi:hypothetical protein